MQKLVLSLIVVLAALGVFGRVRDAGFVWEDKNTLSSALDQDVSLADKTRSIWRRDATQAYTPVTDTFWAATASAKKNAIEQDPDSSARAFHWLNLGVHALSGALVFLILAMVVQSLPAAIFGGLFFALHPLQVEPVSYVSALPFVLGPCFALFAIWQYLLFSQASGEHKSRRKALRYFYLGTIGFMLGVLTLPATVVAAPMALVLAGLVPRRSGLMGGRRSSWPIGVWLALAVVPLFFAFRAEPTNALWQQMAFWKKPIIAGDALSFYVSKVFVPLFVGPDYGRSPSVILSRWWGYVTWVFPLVLLVVLLYWRDKARTWYGAAFMLFIIGIIPFLGVLLVEGQNMSVVADRYAYLAMLGPALAFAYTISMPKRSWLAVAACAALAACVYLTWDYSQHWQDENRLWSNAIKVNPDSPIAHQVLGDQSRQAGEYEQARAHYEKVLQVNAMNPETHFSLAEMETQLGHRAKAIELYNRTLELDPSYKPVHMRLGEALLAEGQLEKARLHFERAVAAQPESRGAQFKLGLIESKLKRHAEAIPYLTRAVAGNANGLSTGEQAQAHALLGLAYAHTNEAAKSQEQLELALKLDPEHAEANRTLADIYYTQKQFDAARKRYEKALVSFKDDPEIYNNLGTILLSTKEYDKALNQLKKALELKPDFADAENNIGVAYFRLRVFDAARDHFKKALDLNPNMADPYFFLGDIMRWEGKQDESLAYYYRTLKIDPDHVDAHYRLGNYFMKEEKVSQALRHYQAALKTQPDDSRLKFMARKAEDILNGSTTM